MPDSGNPPSASTAPSVRPSAGAPSGIGDPRSTRSRIAGGPLERSSIAPGPITSLGLRAARVSAFVLLAVAAFLVFPSLYCERQGKQYLTPSAESRMRVLRGAAFQGEVLKGKDRYATGSSRFDGEWMLFTYVMTASAAGQVYVRNPEEFDESLLVLRRAAERAVGPNARQFDTEAWDGEDALMALGDDANGHGAYLVYLALALGWDRVLQPEGPWADLHDGVIAALERRLQASPTGVFASYPNEFYPADAAIAAAAISLHARALKKPRPEMLDAWETKFRAHCIDPASGLAYQSIGPSGKTDDSHARGSGSAMAAWVLGGSHPQLSRELYASLLSKRYREIFGFAGIREYARGDGTQGDIDSGPLMFGFSPSASAFMLGTARAQHDLRTFSRLYASAHFFGAPVEGDERRNYVVAGPLGDAVLAATLTALEPGEYARIGQGDALMGRALLAAMLWLIAALLYFVLLHIMDREGITGTLMAGHPTFQQVVALLALMGLRVATILLFPAVFFALVVEAVLARILRGGKRKAESSIIEASQIGSSDAS